MPPTPRKPRLLIEDPTGNRELDSDRARGTQPATPRNISKRPLRPMRMTRIMDS